MRWTTLLGAYTVTLSSIVPPGSVWLSPRSGSGGDVQRLEVSFAGGATVSAPFYVCTNGARTSATVHAAGVVDSGTPATPAIWSSSACWRALRPHASPTPMKRSSRATASFSRSEESMSRSGVTDDAGAAPLTRTPLTGDAGPAPIRLVVEQPQVVGSRSECTLEVLP